MARWGMVIDVHRCVGCYTCTITCRQEHFLPRNIYFNRVLITEEGKFPAVRKIILPVQCNHCQEAACVKVCPTGATSQREDGIVLVDSNKCVGCRYCAVACPYQQRTLYKDPKTEYFPKQGFTPYEVLGRKLYPYQPGTILKCTFCVEKIDAGIKKGLKPGIDREATPACVITCPARARYFGDLDDPESEVSRMIIEKKAAPLHPEFDTEPSVYYIKS
jgi:molybdopterin-containing oxidoreductase family iron-sulfur binding subunit